MSEFEYRVGLVSQWFERHMIDVREGGAGWGWVPDVPPNPQNTAEAVCALSRAGKPIPRRADAERLMRREIVRHASGGDWAFRSLVDVAWRLRGLRCLVDEPDDEDVANCVDSLLGAQDVGSGGWRMAGETGPISVTATCMALISLSGLERPIDTRPAVHRAVEMLADSVLKNDPRAEPLYARAQIASVLARSELQSFYGPQVERACEKALDSVIEDLESESRQKIQEEIFSRGSVTDIWRHTTLYLAIKAVADAAPDCIFEPAFRNALIELLELQEQGIDNVNFGGFRTSREGFVTSYATTQALQALVSTEIALGSQANPGKAFDLLCSSTGIHHSDPQNVVTVAGRKVIMNSWAGAATFSVGLVAFVTISGLTIAFQTDLGHVISRLLLTWSTIFLATGTFVYASVRLPKISNGKIALAVFTAFTAIFLPIIFFVFA